MLPSLCCANRSPWMVAFIVLCKSFSMNGCLHCVVQVVLHEWLPSSDAKNSHFFIQMCFKLCVFDLILQLNIFWPDNLPFVQLWVFTIYMSPGLVHVYMCVYYELATTNFGVRDQPGIKPSWSVTPCVIWQECLDPRFWSKTVISRPIFPLLNKLETGIYDAMFYPHCIKSEVLLVLFWNTNCY